MSKTQKNRQIIGAERGARRSSSVLSAPWRTPKDNNKKGQPINKIHLGLPAILCAISFVSAASADVVFDSVGIIEADAVKKFDGMRQHGILLSYRVRSDSDRFWIPSSLELSAGWLERGADTAEFVIFGASYRMHLGSNDFGRWFTDFGSQPTYISKSTFNGKPLGGKFFFTSYLGLGAYLDRQRRTSFLLRYQHTSNAGMDGDNPGVDMIGLTLNYHFGGNRRLFAAGNPSR